MPRNQLAKGTGGGRPGDASARQGGSPCRREGCRARLFSHLCPSVAEAYPDEAFIAGRTAWNGTYSQLAFESISAGFIRNRRSRQDLLDEIEFIIP